VLREEGSEMRVRWWVCGRLVGGKGRWSENVVDSWVHAIGGCKMMVGGLLGAVSVMLMCDSEMMSDGLWCVEMWI
jgi:hypothetical protein